jgi:hypothetical protein
MQLRPSDVKAREKIKEHIPRSSLDVTSSTYQCNSCAGAGRLLAAKEKELQKLLRKKKPHENIEAIRTRRQRLELLRANHPEISPNFKATREGQTRGRRHFAAAGETGKKWPLMTRANLIRRWSADELPKRIRFGLCLACSKLVINYCPAEQKPHFHRECHKRWEMTQEGKDYQSQKIRGVQTSLIAPKFERPVTEESLKRSYSYAVQHYLGGKPFSEIAARDDLHLSAVEERVKSILEKLPMPQLLGARFRRSVELLLEASRTAPNHSPKHLP